MLLEHFLFAIILGITWAPILALIAVGFTVSWGLMRVVNIAHGEFCMLGAVLTFIMVISYGIGFFWVSLILIPIFGGVIGLLLYHFLLAKVQARARSEVEEQLPTIVITIGVLYIIDQIVLMFFGGTAQRLPSPIAGSYAVLGYEIPLYRVVIAIISTISLLGLWFLIHKTNFGLNVRAVIQNRELALAMGVNTPFVGVLSFFLASAFATVAGILASPVTAIHFLMGFDFLILAVIVVVIGTLGNIKGAIVASIIIALLESQLSVFFTPVQARITSLAILTVLLLILPTGLFGRRKM